MINLFSRLTEFFLQPVGGGLDGDGSGGIDFFEMLIEPEMPALAEKLGRFGWLFVLALVLAVIALVLVLANIKRLEVGPAAAILIAVGAGYFAGHGVMMIALILSIPLGIILWLDRASRKRGVSP